MGEVEDLRWLEVACDLAASCPPSSTAFSVGAVVVGADGRELARGYSRETDDKVHAEEAALAKIPGMDLAGATVYSSLEPCARRLSRPKPCARLIVERGAGRVVFAWREPALFVEGDGFELLEHEGVEVVEIPALAARAKLPNAHLL
ncbi:dCMP deaminase [Actinocorallia sp. A-T 12471]|uniref:dCMP deaminase n=1 Tax=Actinocorallia sp. A-T 12471 TaxID=3089813 RepID=UPI0029CE80DC|nr:dCMP deaminase [Actinocorallia sp. A-T 12471]MDX6739461.1 dCMP deaminase [Actinocorallia sp. A-T 12471]